MSCPTCQIVVCTNPSDFNLYNLNDGTIFTNPTFSFVLDCPPGYVCHGNYPITITIPPGVIQLPVPPNPTVIRLTCCQGDIARTVPAGATSAQIAAIASEVVALCAAQQAQCDVKTQPPGPGQPPPTPIIPPGTPPPTRTDVFNQEQTVIGECGSGNTGNVTSTVPARTYGETLFNATAAVIAARQAALNLIALQQATNNLTGLAPVITSGTADNASKNVAYSYQIPATGGTQPYTFVITSGSLPAGLTMDADGNITGTPTTNGSSSFTVTIGDDEGNSCSREISLTVSDNAKNCPTVVGSFNANLYGYQQMAYDPVEDRLFCPNFPGQTVTRFNPNTNLIDGTASASFYPSAVSYVPATTLVRLTTASFTSPAIGANIPIVISSTALLAAGQNITIGVKTYQVVSVDSDVDVTVKNVDEGAGVIHGIGTSLSIAFTGGILCSAEDTPAVSSWAYFIDPVTFAVTQLVQLTGTTATASSIYCSVSKKVWFALTAGNGIDVFDVVSGAITNIPSTYQTFIGGYKSSTGEVFVYGFSGNNITVNSISETTFAVLKSYYDPLGTTGFPILTYCPTNDTIYAGNVYNDAVSGIQTMFLSIINATTFALSTNLILGTEVYNILTKDSPRPCYSSTQDFVYAQYGSFFIPVATKIIDPATNTVVCTMPIGITSGVDSPTTNRFYGVDDAVSGHITETKP